MGRPVQRPNTPFALLSNAIQWKIFLKGIEPSGKAYIFCILVLALSNGSDAQAAAPPAKKLAITHPAALFYGIISAIFSLADS